MAGVIASHLRDAGLKDHAGEALAILSTMVGGLALARALRGTELSDTVLKACRDHIVRALYPER
jgi:hypothetical protein